MVCVKHLCFSVVNTVRTGSVHVAQNHSSSLAPQHSLYTHQCSLPRNALLVCLGEIFLLVHVSPSRGATAQ